ncbi:MAG: thioredoxin family protein [Parasphingorhabdus sp.]|nr:thioredoxin family protein [Parasphingorhabdus sp.]
MAIGKIPMSGRDLARLTSSAPPKGVTVGKPRFPVPETLLVSGIMNYVYENQFAILVDVTVATDVAPGTKLPLSVKSAWLACTKEVCVPAQGTLQTSLTVGGGGMKDPKFNLYRERLPSPLGSEASFAADSDGFRLSVPFPKESAVEKPYFYILQDGIVDYGALQKVSRDGDRLIVETAARGSGPETITGILKIGDHRGLLLEAKRGTVEGGGVPIVSTEGSGPTDGPLDYGLLVTALAGAVLGGLLLNLMPCVFPILSLKAISLAKSGGNEKDARADALAYTAGVVLVATALGALLLGLRAGGAAVGWAFQLQDPRIIFVLLVLVTGIAVNLAGLFELPNLAFGNRLAANTGRAGSFWTGALAAFVATPCTGPFMAAAVGATLVLPPVAAIFIFAGLGIGLALPFLAIAYIPALRARLPKPGAWLDGFKKLMAVPMFVTAIGLIWLLGAQVGNNALALALFFLLAIILLLWLVGSTQRGGGGLRGIALSGALAALIVGIFILPLDGPGDGSLAQANVSATLPAEAFSEARLASLRAENRPVFAYFTADWCITCKANEAAAIQRSETARAFRAANVAVLEGDWTRPDPAISRYLEAHGRAGVPLYVFYPAGGEPQILPQLLTVEMLTRLVAT